MSNLPLMRPVRPEEFGLDSAQWRRPRSMDFGLAPDGACLLRWSADTWQAS